MAFNQYDPYNVYDPGSNYEEGLSAGDIGAGLGEGSSSYVYPSPSVGGSPSESPYTRSDLVPYAGGYESPGGGGGGNGWQAPAWAPEKPAGSKFGDKPFMIGGTNRVTTQSNVAPPGVNPPVYPTSLPEFKLPEYDQNRVQSLTELAAGPSMRKLRNQMREVQGKYYENPNVKRMTLRDALAGYGLGLENAMAGARKQAVEEYQAEYAPKVSAAQMNYQAQLNQMNAQYQAAYQNYMNRVAKQTVTTMG